MNKEDIANMKAWDTEKQRYQLTSPWQGAVLYSLKESMKGVEPPHYICTNCYHDGAKSILNQEFVGGGKIAFVCPRCKSSHQALGSHSSGFKVEYV